MKDWGSWDYPGSCRDACRPSISRRSFAGAEWRLPDEGLGRHLPRVAVAYRDRCDVASLMHSDRLVLEKDWSILPICLPPLSKIFMVSSYVETKLRIRVTSSRQHALARYIA